MKMYRYAALWYLQVSVVTLREKYLIIILVASAGYKTANTQYNSQLCVSDGSLKSI